MTLTVALLADRPACIPAVADLRWREWGHPPEPEDRSWWLDTTTREAGREDLPVTFVALDQREQTVGAVGLAEYDLDEWRDRSPWIIGMIVHPAHRRSGIGSRLLGELESWAGTRGVTEAWVATGAAETFYRRCGWSFVDAFVKGSGEPMSVLHKRLVRRTALPQAHGMVNRDGV